MRKLTLFLLLSLLLSLSVRANTSIITGTVVDSQGNPVNGILTMRLPVPAVDTTTGVAIAPTPVRYNIVNGVIQGGAIVPLYDVATLQPLNLYYQGRVTDTSGTFILGGNYVVTGATFNFGLAIPTSVTTNNISYVSPAVTNAPNVFCCTQTFQGQIVSTIATGTAPFSVASTTLVPNLNVGGWGNVFINGVPTVGQVPIALTATTAAWGNQAAGGTSTYNNGGAGTVTGLLVKFSGAPSSVVTAGLGDTGGVIGVCVSGCGTIGTATIEVSGQAPCSFDGATTAGDYVQISGTTQGDCHDVGATFPRPGQVVGRVQSTNGGAGSYTITVFPAENNYPVIVPLATKIQVIKKITGCNTGGGSNSACQDTLTWPVTFGSTGYTVTCQGVTTAQFIGQSITNSAAVLVIDSYTATQVIVTTETMRSLVAQFSEIDCIGVLP